MPKWSEKKSTGMKVRYLGESDPLELMHGKVYDVVSINKHGLYRIVNETDEDYLYPAGLFEVVQKPAE